MSHPCQYTYNPQTSRKNCKEIGTSKRYGLSIVQIVMICKTVIQAAFIRQSLYLRHPASQTNSFQDIGCSFCLLSKPKLMLCRPYNWCLKYSRFCRFFSCIDASLCYRNRYSSFGSYSCTTSSTQLYDKPDKWQAFVNFV